jgi:hypothetical protein
MSGTLALHILYCNILCMLCILLWNQFFYSYIVSLVVLRNFCKYFVGMTDKVRRTTAFLSWYSQTSLLEVRFALTLHAWTALFDAKFLPKVSAISCIFVCFDSSLCFDRICIHMVKILSLIYAELSCCIFTR